MAKKKPNFGGMKIKPEGSLADFLGTEKALSPAEFTKRVWQKLKSKKMIKKSRKAA